MAKLKTPKSRETTPTVSSPEPPSSRRTADNPLEGRPGLKIESAQTDALAIDLGRLARDHGLLGCVLISFTQDRVGVNSGGVGNFARHMETLGDRLLAAIDDGKFEPQAEPKQANARSRGFLSDVPGQ